MQIQLELWHLISLAVTVIGAYAGIAKLLMAQYTKSMDEKFVLVREEIKALGQQNARYGDDVLRLERQLNDLRLEVWRDFTQRDDHNRDIASIRIGQDNMSLRLEKVLGAHGNA